MKKRDSDDMKKVDFNEIKKSEFDAVKKSVRDRLMSYLETYHMEETLRLFPTSTFTLSIDTPELEELFTIAPTSFVELIRDCVVTMLANNDPDADRESYENDYARLNIRLSAQKADKLSELTADSINSPICFNGVIMGLDKIESYITKVHLVCPSGHPKGDMIADVPPSREIPFAKCIECEEILVVDPDTSKYDYLQRGTIQEPPEELKIGQPTERDIVFFGNQLKEVTINDRKEIIGLLKPIYNKKENRHALIIDTISIHDIEGKEELLPGYEEIKRLKDDARDIDFLTKLAKSFAPEVLPNDLLLRVKKTILLALVGGTKTPKKRGDINILLLGDPSVAKSSMLKAGNRIVRKSMFTSGRGSSAAGLTLGVVKRPDGTSRIQMGVLPLCHKGFAFIDEFDKMRPEDRSSLHEAMEQRQVSSAKSSSSGPITMPAETAIIAAANPRGGKWDPEMTVVDNVNLPPTLLSRFDVKWLIRDVVNRSQDERIAKHILNEYTGGTGAVYSETDLMKILNYARKIRPTITKEASEMMQDFYVELRSKSNQMIDSEGGSAPLAQAIIDPRQLESLIRMSTAHAKIHFRDQVTETDVSAVIELFKAALESIFGDGIFEHEEYYRVQQSTFEQSARQSKEMLFWKVWHKHENDEGYVTSEKLRDVIEELATFPKYWSIETVEAYINKLHNKGVLLISRFGYKKVARY